MFYKDARARARLRMVDPQLAARLRTWTPAATDAPPRRSAALNVGKFALDDTLKRFPLNSEL